MGNGIKVSRSYKNNYWQDYPGPIVVHEKARAAALKAFQSLKKK